jgi:hypothetical protein
MDANGTDNVETTGIETAKADATENTDTVAGGADAADSKSETADTGKTETVAAEGDKSDGKADTKEAAKGDEKKPDAKAPTDIEVKFPDGWETDNEALAKFKPLAKDLGLDSAKAQKLVDLFVDATSKAGEARQAKNEATLDGWLKDAKADKDIGGAKWDGTVANVRRVVREFGDDQLRSLFNDTGIGDHPAVLRFLNKLGSRMAEDKFAGSEKPASDDPETALQRALYTHPTSQPQKRS